MKRHLLFLAALLIVNLAASAQKKFSVYAVGFYNQENLFDTCYDEGKKDYEYLPNKLLNGMNYTKKLSNMSKALASLYCTAKYFYEFAMTYGIKEAFKV